ARDRRRRLPVGARDAPRVDDRVRGDGGGVGAGRAPFRMGGTRGVPRGRPGAAGVLRSRRGPRRRRRARGRLRGGRARGRAGRTMTRRAKLVCTVGPATGTPERIRELLDAGTDVVRVIFTHGGAEYHASIDSFLRHARRTYGW